MAPHKTEPNSGLGKAIAYLLSHWLKLTLFLQQPGAPIDNNIVNAAGGICGVMPTPGLCRARVGRVLRLRRISASQYSRSRHNQRLSKNASRESGGRKRSGTAFDAVACASAFSLSCISA
jgi:hypothetical protein